MRYHQGFFDNLCSIYAIINSLTALGLLNEDSANAANDMFNFLVRKVNEYQGLYKTLTWGVDCDGVEYLLAAALSRVGGKFKIDRTDWPRLSETTPVAIAFISSTEVLPNGHWIAVSKGDGHRNMIHDSFDDLDAVVHPISSMDHKGTFELISGRAKKLEFSRGNVLELRAASNIPLEISLHEQLEAEWFMKNRG